ncbi:MAG: hypothetical protein H6719_12320 [Sandaracinaceae bacterium]|nr:hypothetical protein [Sandaracinaceae bacterium]
MRGVLTILGALALMASASHASAQAALDEGRALWAEADYEQAAAVFDAVLADPSSDHRAILQSHRYLFAIRSVLGDPAAAERHGRAALALNPNVTPPDGAEQLAGALEALRSATHPVRLLLTYETERRHARVRLLDDAGLVETLTLRCVHGAWSDVAEGPSPDLELAIAPEVGGELGCNATARTASRALLLEGQDAFTLPPPDPDAGRDDPLIIALGIGGALLAVAALVAIVVGVTVSTPVVLGACVDGWSC